MCMCKCNRVTRFVTQSSETPPLSYISSNTSFIFAYVPAGLWQLSTLQINTGDTLKSPSANCLAIKTSITQQLQCLLIKQLLAVIQMAAIRLIIFQAPFHATLWLSLATILAFPLVDMGQNLHLEFMSLPFDIILHCLERECCGENFSLCWPQNIHSPTILTRTVCKVGSFQEFFLKYDKERLEIQKSARSFVTFNGSSKHNVLIEMWENFDSWSEKIPACLPACFCSLGLKWMSLLTLTENSFSLLTCLQAKSPFLC